MSSRFALLAIFLVACGSSSSENGEREEIPSRPAAAAVDQTPLPGVETRALEDAEKRSFFRIVSSVNSPCGEAVSVAQCVRDGANECSECRHAANYTVRLLASGYPAEMTRELLRLRYAADTKAEVSTEGCVFVGNENASVTFVEYADFECPHCKLAHEVFEQLFAQPVFASKARLCYRYFPLEGHQHARAAARAAAAAALQGKSWQMNDLIYDNQMSLSDEKFLALATQLNLDMARFRTDIASPEVEATVARDRASGEALLIEGTPTFFVNGRRYGESLDPDSISAYVAEELTRR